MIEKSLMVTMLTVLREQADLRPATEENALFNELNLRANQPVTSSLLREHTTFAQDKGWIERSTGVLNEPRWRITPAGRGALSDFSRGG